MWKFHRETNDDSHGKLMYIGKMQNNFPNNDEFSVRRGVLEPRYRARICFDDIELLLYESMKIKQILLIQVFNSCVGFWTFLSKRVFFTLPDP